MTVTAMPVTSGVSSKLDLAALKNASSNRGPWVTILAPPFRPGAGEGSPNVVVSELVREARGLVDASPFGARAGEILAAFDDAALDWREGGPGVAWIGTPKSFTAFEWSGGHNPKAVFSTYPYIAPLLAEALAPKAFSILGLNRKRLRLFEYEGGACREVAIPEGVPSSLDDASGADRVERDQEKLGAIGEHLLAYFRAVGKAFRDRRLVLFGVQEDIHAYRTAVKELDNILAEVQGASETLIPSVAGTRSFEAAVEAIGNIAVAELEAFRRSHTTAPLGDPREIYDAAAAGRVHRLYVREGTHFIAPIDPLLSLTHRPEDLISAAVCETWRHGGEIVLIPREKMTVAHPLAAALRY